MFLEKQNLTLQTLLNLFMEKNSNIIHKTKGIVKNIFFITLPTLFILFVILEIIFRILPVSDYPKFDFNAKYALRTFDMNWKTSGQHSIGNKCRHLSFWSLNNEGWNSDIDYSKTKKKKRIAIIGDSYVEAMQVDTGFAFPQILRKAFKDSVDVYSFGIGGAPLYHYYHMARYVDEHFNPDIFVFNIIHNDFDQSLAAHVNYNREFWTLEEKTTKDSIYFVPLRPIFDRSKDGIKSLVKRSALFRYLNYNVNIRAVMAYQKFKKETEGSDNSPYFENNTNMSLLIEDAKKINDLMNYVFDDMNKSFSDKNIIFIMDGPRQFIYENRYLESKVPEINSMMEKACQKNNIYFLDLGPLFFDDYSQNKIRFEFEEDYHWNKYGHDFVAHSLQQFLLDKKILH